MPQISKFSEFSSERYTIHVTHKDVVHKLKVKVILTVRIEDSELNLFFIFSFLFLFLLDLK